MPHRLPPRNAHARAQARISARLDAEREKPRNLRKTSQGLASELGIVKSAVTEMLSGTPERGLLYHLDTIADYLGMMPAEIVKRDKSTYLELSEAETRIIAHIRQFPPAIRDMIAVVYDYFGGLLPEERDQREWWVKLRPLSGERRLAVMRVLDHQYAAEMQSRRGKGKAPVDQGSNAEKPPAIAPTRGKTPTTERRAVTRGTSGG